MGKSKSPSIPSAPSFQADPNLAWSQDYLKGQTNYLTQGLTTEGGNLAGLLGDTINVSPLVSQYSQQLAQSQLDPAFRVRQQDMMNQLEANNQLTGSTTASSLGNLNADYMASLTGMQAQYGLADVQRALNTRVELYGMGLNTGQAVGSNALSNQNQMNQFALANYENQVASALMSQGSQKGGWLGAIQGAIGGAMSGASAGSAAGPYGAIAGGVVGAGLGGYSGYQSQGSGGNYLSSGLSLLGSNNGYSLGSKYSSPSSISGGSESIFNPATSYTGGSNSYGGYNMSSYGSAGRLGGF